MAAGTSEYRRFHRPPGLLLWKYGYDRLKEQSHFVGRGGLDRSFSCFCPAPSLCGRDLLTRFHAQYALALDLRGRTIDRARAPAVTIGRALQQSLHLL